MTDQTNTPELRFPEFNTDWTTNQAKNLFTNVSDKKHDGDLLVLSATQDKGMVPRQDLDLEIKYDKKNLSNYKRTLPNDFIISLRSFQGGFELNTIEGIVSPAYTVLRGEEELVQPKFFKQYFKSIRFIKKLDSMIYGIRDGKSISYKEFSTFSINYPSILEQQKIGNFFSKLDHQIELEEEKLELLEQQKKGYMQKIFSKELRFKDENGNDYPNWEIQKLGQIAMINTGKSKISNEIDGEFFNLGSTGIIGKSNHFDYEGSFLLTARVGHYAGSLYTFKGKANITDNTIFMQTNLSLEFIKELLNNYNLKRLAFGSGQPLIKSSELKNLKFNIPCVDEIEKIGKLFNKLNETIELHTSKIELLKQRKKGLLQRMFV
ncbi:restriction endonuclease subunit S [Staphylococcus capitis]|uniref:restriction endonuclease subunit S n=1 Tax=Staphylococcus capitis TaxID=29388 RepID=UPI003D80645A